MSGKGKTISEIAASNFRATKGRVENLVKQYVIARGKGRARVEQLDLLRAAVVLLHAGMEEILRELLRSLLPTSKDALKQIAILGAEHKRTEKMTLSDLFDHKNLRVDTLIRESVRVHLDRSNYNTISEVVNVLESVGLKWDGSPKLHASLAGLIQRRHQIVHQADRNIHAGQGQHSATSIAVVNKWTRAASDLAKFIVSNIPPTPISKGLSQTERRMQEQLTLALSQPLRRTKQRGSLFTIQSAFSGPVSIYNPLGVPSTVTAARGISSLLPAMSSHLLPTKPIPLLPTTKPKRPDRKK